MTPKTEKLFRPNDLHSGYLNPAGAVFEYYDSSDDPFPLECENCGQETAQGFLCMDDSSELCEACAEILPAWLGMVLTEEWHERMQLHNRIVAMRSIIGIGVAETFAARLKSGKPLGWVEATPGYRNEG